MRIIRYYIVNKQTRQAVYTDCRKSKCEAFLNAMADSESYYIGYKWLSI